MESLFALFIVVEDDPEHFEDLYDGHLLSRRSDGPHLFCRRSDDGHLVCQRSVFEEYGRDLFQILEGISSVFEEMEDGLYDGSGSLAWEEKFDNFLNNLSGFPDFSAESITRIYQKNSALVTEITYLVRLSEAYNELFVKRQWWSRAWIIQEVIHSGKVLVHIGNLKPIDFEEFLAIGRDVFPYTDAMPSRAQKVALADRGMECVWPILIPFFKPLHNTAHQLYSIRNSLQKGTTNSLSLFGTHGSGAFFCFRRQKAADDRDKIYAFIGLQNDFLSSLQLLYEISKASLYAIITRGSFVADLRNILGIECWERIPTRGDELSSWVIDFSKEQNLTARLKFEEHWPGFQADFGFPSLPCVEDEPYLKQDILDPDLIIRGIDVAVVTAVYDMGLPEQLIPGQDKVLLLRYDTNRRMSESQII